MFLSQLDLNWSVGTHIAYCSAFLNQRIFFRFFPQDYPINALLYVAVYTSAWETQLRKRQMGPCELLVCTTNALQSFPGSWLHDVCKLLHHRHSQCARASKRRCTSKLAEPTNHSLFQDLCSDIWGLHINHLTVTCLEAFYLDMYFLYERQRNHLIDIAAIHTKTLLNCTVSPQNKWHGNELHFVQTLQILGVERLKLLYVFQKQELSSPIECR